MMPHQQKCITTPQLLEQLTSKSRESRQLIVDALTGANSSHLGCGFSVIDILTVLYHCFLNIDAIKKTEPSRDYFILSKGHSASALYAALATNGIIDSSILKQYHHNGGPLAGHPLKGCLPGIEASTGSLGHGLSLGVGIALAAKHDGCNKRVYVLVGDGECQEGSIWEALAMASRFKLNNLTIIIDYNNLQGLDKTDDIMPHLDEKCEAFGSNVIHVNGHDHAALINTFNFIGMTDKPDVIIAHTIKGKGISFIENRLEWHYKSLKQDQYEQAKGELQRS